MSVRILNALSFLKNRDGCSEGRDPRHLIEYLPDSTCIYRSLKVNQLERLHCESFGLPRSPLPLLEKASISESARIGELSAGHRVLVHLSLILSTSPWGKAEPAMKSSFVLNMEVRDTLKQTGTVLALMLALPALFVLIAAGNGWFPLLRLFLGLWRWNMTPGLFHATAILSVALGVVLPAMLPLLVLAPVYREWNRTPENDSKGIHPLCGFTGALRSVLSVKGFPAVMLSNQCIVRLPRAANTVSA